VKKEEELAFPDSNSTVADGFGFLSRGKCSQRYTSKNKNDKKRKKEIRGR